MQTKVVFDWDGVVFDDDFFKRHMQKNLQEKTNLELSEIETAYQESKDSNGYNDVGLVERLADMTGQNVAVLLNCIHSVMNEEGKGILYDDARELLRFLGPQNCVALTAGDDRIQSHKISATGMTDAFSHIEIVSAKDTALNKEKYLQELLASGYKVLFYDDKISTILHLHEVFRAEPNFSAVWVNREDRVQKNNFFVTDNLSLESYKSHALTLGRRRTLSASVRIESDEGKLLLVQESSGRAKGRWTLPMGHVDHDETFMATALREPQEECALRVQIRDIHRIAAVEGEDYMGGEQDIGSLVLIVCFDAIIESALQYEPELKNSWVASDDIVPEQLRGEWQAAFFE